MSILLTLAALVASPPVAPAPDIAVVEWQGKKVCEVLMEDTEVRISRCSLPAGATHLRHHHMTRFVYRLSDGEERTTDAAGTRDSASKAGDYGVAPALDWHQVLNAGSGELRYVIVDLKYRDRAPPQ